MVRIYECNFCGHNVEAGTGMAFVRKNGQLVRFCSRKCQRALLDFKRDPRKFKTS
ncbi:MAG: 50S ribosomal protein L24e [Candidatus Hodarchaeales archaeon]